MPGAFAWWHREGPVGNGLRGQGAAPPSRCGVVAWSPRRLAGGDCEVTRDHWGAFAMTGCTSTARGRRATMGLAEPMPCASQSPGFPASGWGSLRLPTGSVFACYLQLLTRRPESGGEERRLSLGETQLLNISPPSISRRNLELHNSTRLRAKIHIRCRPRPSARLYSSGNPIHSLCGQ